MKALLQSLLDIGVNDQCFPSAAAAVGCRNECYAACFSGSINTAGQKPDHTTLYDMASCTKILSTTMLALLFIEQGKMTLDDTLDRFFPVPTEQSGISIRQLMTHTSGIIPHTMLHELPFPPEQVIQTILSLPLAGEPGIPRYSCLGYILLGKVLETISRQPLDRLASALVFAPLGMANTCYCPESTNVAPTELNPKTGHPFSGIVHDENARFLHGVAGNAGVFSCIDDCIRYAQMLACSGGGFLTSVMIKKAIQNHTAGHDTHRGLGFQLGGVEGSFFGDLFPETAFGHTGFTGTSIAIDPETGFYVILLSNRVCPSRDNIRHLRFRRVLHNALYAEFTRTFRSAKQ